MASAIAADVAEDVVLPVAVAVTVAVVVDVEAVVELLAQKYGKAQYRIADTSNTTYREARRLSSSPTDMPVSSSPAARRISWLPRI